MRSKLDAEVAAAVKTLGGDGLHAPVVDGECHLAQPLDLRSMRVVPTPMDGLFARKFVRAVGEVGDGVVGPRDVPGRVVGAQLELVSLAAVNPSTKWPELLQT